jgi:hypothetical protein
MKNQEILHGYVFMDYKLGALVYHFTNLVIGTNIQLQTISRKDCQRYDTSYLIQSMRN